MKTPNILQSFRFTGVARSERPSVQVQKVLQQKFRYIADGGTMYVFESADKKYVLKICKAPHEIVRKYISWGMDLGGTSWSGVSVNGDALATARNLLRKQCQCVDYLSQHRKKEHALVYTNLSAQGTDFGEIDCTKFLVHTHKTPFVLQKKVQIIKDLLMPRGQLIQEKVAKRIFQDVALAVHKEWQQGVFSVTMNIHHNYGYHGTIVRGIDVGDYLYGEGLSKNDLTKVMRDFIKSTAKEIAQTHPKTARGYEEYLIRSMRSVTQRM